MIRIGIIGYGYWGPNLVRNFFNTKDCVISLISDTRQERLNIVNSIYPSIRTTLVTEEVLKSEDTDAIVISTPVFTHYPLAEKALNYGKHVLIEKPMSSSSEQAQKLIELSLKNNRVLMVDHTFLYNGSVQKIKNLVDGNHVGTINYFDSTRINLGLFQPDINVLWDLAVHDLSILLHLIAEKPRSVNATGISHTQNGIENIAYMTVKYESGIIAHFNCSWSSPVKIRQILIGGSKKMIVYNDMEPTEKVKIFDTGYNIKSDEDKRKVLVDYRAGDVYSPKVELKEALAGLASDFIASIKSGRQPLSNYDSGLEVVKILEASQVSLKNNGKEIIL